MRKNEKGITLIALVITIIILLILAGISIATLSGENGLINRAVTAKDNTESAQEIETLQQAAVQAIGKSKSGDVEKQYLDAALANNSEIEGTEDGDDGIEVTFRSGRVYIVDSDGNVGKMVIVDRTGINVGNYIDYTPDVDSNTKYPASNLTTYSGVTSNNNDIVQDSLDWQVLRIYRDGSMDLIGSPTSQKIAFNGLKGYTYGVYLMDDICKTLYSRNANGIEARSVDLEDFNYWLKQSTGGVAARDSYSNGTYTYGDSETYTSANKYPKFYKTQTSESDPGSLTNDSSYETNGDLTVSQTSYTIPINNNNIKPYSTLYTVYSYWLGTRCVNLDTDKAGFGLRFASTYINSDVIYYSGVASAGYTGRYLRPVVHLKSSTKITPKAGTKNDKHQITSY